LGISGAQFFPGWLLRACNFGPLAMSFPYAERKRKRHVVFELLAEKFADILDRRVFEEIVPGPVIVADKDLAQTLLQVGEVNDHSTFRFPFDCDFDLIGVSVQWTAFGMAGQKMGGIDVFGYTELHGVRIAWVALRPIKWGARTQGGKPRERSRDLRLEICEKIQESGGPTLNAEGRLDSPPPMD